MKLFNLEEALAGKKVVDEFGNIYDNFHDMQTEGFLALPVV
jgi:hypothetical protein